MGLSWARMDPPAAEPMPTDLPRGRRALLALLLLAIALGHLACFVLERKDLWPFSTYAMYTKLRHPEQASQHLLVGVTPEQEEVEISLSWEYLRPLYRGSLNKTLKRFAAAQDSERLRAAAGDALRRYELRRRAGLHDGPQLSGMRVYRYVWRYTEADPAQRARPTDRELLAAAHLPEAPQ